MVYIYKNKDKCLKNDKQSQLLYQYKDSVKCNCIKGNDMDHAYFAQSCIIVYFMWQCGGNYLMLMI